MFRVDKSMHLSKNFILSEFACKDGTDYIEIDYLLIQKLQAMRDAIKAPITIVSGYRTRTYNDKCGGAENSQHLYGKAADIKVANMTPETLYAIAKRFDFPGIGIYDTFVHVDTRNTGTWDGDMRVKNKGRTIPTIK